MILFRDAILVDGSGAPPARGSLLVRDGRIECLGANIEPPECEVIECNGQVLSLQDLSTSTVTPTSKFSAATALIRTKA